MGLWDLMDKADIAPLRDAKVIDGPSSFSMLIGQAAWQGVQQAIATNADITLMAGEKVTAVQTDDQVGSVTLASGKTLTARLVVAADSRYSSTRRMMGIAAQMHDFGKNMLVCCNATRANKSAQAHSLSGG